MSILLICSNVETSRNWNSKFFHKLLQGFVKSYVVINHFWFTKLNKLFIKQNILCKKNFRGKIFYIMMITLQQPFLSISKFSKFYSQIISMWYYILRFSENIFTSLHTKKETKNQFAQKQDGLMFILTKDFTNFIVKPYYSSAFSIWKKETTG